MWGHEGLSGLKPYLAAHGYPECAVRLDANELGFELPLALREEIAREVAELAWNRYPDAGAARLRDAIGAFIHAPSSSLVLGAGSDELIAMLSTAFTRPRGARTRAVVLYPEPTFVMYGITARAHHLDPVGVPLRSDWKLDVGAMIQAIDTHQPNLIYFASPNNPTGNTFDEGALETIIRHARESLIVIDEAYVAFASHSLGDWVARFANVAALGTLSKIGLAALRIGWARLSPALAAELEKVRQPYNLNALSQHVAERVLSQHSSWLRTAIKETVSARSTLADKLGEIHGWTVQPSSANFLLVKVPSAAQVAASLRAQNIWVRHFEAHPSLSDYLRITVGLPAENDALLDAVSKLKA